MSASQRLGVESTSTAVVTPLQKEGSCCCKVAVLLAGLGLLGAPFCSSASTRVGRLLSASCFERSCHVLRVALHYVSGAFFPLRVIRVAGFSLHLDPSACSHTFVHQLVSLRLHVPASPGRHHHSDLRGVFNVRLKLDYSTKHLANLVGPSV